MKTRMVTKGKSKFHNGIRFGKAIGNSLSKFAIVLTTIMLIFTNTTWGQNTGTFTKITALSDLTDGYYVIASTTKAMKNTNATNFFDTTNISPSGSIISNPPSSIIWKIQTHVDGGRTIYNEATSKYVSFTGASNAAFAVSSVTGGSERWTFTYVSSLFVVTNVTSTTRILQYNSASPRFACYTSAQQKFTLYKLTIPDIALTSTNPSVPIANLTQSTTKNPIYKFSTAVTTADATLNTVSFTTTNTAADVTKYQLWYKTSDDLSTATQIGTDITTGLGSGSHSFTTLANTTAAGSTGYFWITADLAAAATPTNTIIVSAIDTSNIVYSSGTKSGTASVGGTQTIIAASSPSLGTTALADFGSQCINGTYGPNSFTLTGSSLTTADVTVGALSGYSYSTTSGGSYTPTLTITPNLGSINQVVYVKFSPTLVQSYNGDIAISGGGAGSINRSVTGSGVYTAPVVTSAATNPIANTTATLNGSATTLGVCPATTEKGFVYSATSANADPIVGGTGVTKTPVAGLATGAFTLPLTGLTPNTGYSFKSYLYDGSTYTYGAVTTFSTLASASKLVFSVSPPATGFINTNIASFTVQAQRADNSVDSEYTGNVVIAKTTGSGAISGTLTVAAVAGVASFTTVKFDATDTYTITASSGALTTVTSGNIVINPAPTTIIAWQLNGKSGSEATINASTNDANLNTSILTRASGLTASALANVYGATNYTSSGTKATAISGNKYIYFTINSKVGSTVSLSTLDARFRRSAAGPNAFRWQYSIDGTTFFDIGSGDISYTSTTTGGDAQTQIDLSGVTDLQNVPSTTTITIRLLGWGASATTGTFAIGRSLTAAATDYSLSIGGNITSVPADIALSDNGTQVVAANVLQGANNQILSTYKLAVTSANATLTEADFITSGNYQAADINGSGFKLWYNSTNDFPTATAIGTALASTSTGSGDLLQFTTLNQLINAGSTGYFWVTANIASGATVGRTISIDAIANADLIFSSGNKSGSATAGGVQTIIAPTLPTITIGGTVTAFSNQCINTTSGEKSFTVEGSTLTNDITITVPAGFEISKTSGSNFGSSVTLTNSGGSVLLTTIYVRFIPTLAQLYSVNITCSTAGGSDQLVALSGTGTFSAPAVTSSAATNVLSTTATINGNVTTLGVCPNTTEKGFVYSITSANADPIVGGTGVTKTAVAGLASGAFLLNLTGLTASTGYTFKSYLYDGSTYTYGSALTFSTSAPCPSAALPFVENFEYSNAVSLSANCWITHSAGLNPIKAYTSSITYPNYLSSGIGNEATLTANGEDDNIAFASQNSGTVYTSFLINVSSASTAGDYFAHLGGTAGATVTGFYGRVYVKKDASSSNIAFGITKNSGTANYTGFNYALGNTYLVVVKYSIVGGATNDITELYIDPVLNKPIPSATISATDNATADATQLTSFCLRQSTTTPALKFDGIRISNNWYDIVGNTIALSSTAGSDNQTSCINTPITNITYTTTGATGATFSGLPAGVNGSWNANVVTISGTPSVANTFNYTVTLTGGTGNGTATGTIIVNDLPTASISYASASYNTSVNTPQSVIINGTGTYTGGTYSASPAGLTIDQNSGAITPSSSSLNVYTVTYSIPASGGCGIVNVTTQVTITAPVVATTTFTGTGNWNNAGLWDFGIPTASTHAIINGSCTITASATCKNLTINPAKDLTVNAGQALAVTGQLLIKSTAAGTGSYINNGTVTYSLTPKVERYITQNVWHLITSPVQSAVSGLWSGLYLKDYNEATNTFNAPFSSTTVPLTVGKGFAIWSAATTGNATRTYTGNLNNSDYPISLVWSNAAHGWNLIGNMFTSAITGDINNWTKVNVYNSIYVWNGANYLTWNGTAGTLAGGIIPAGQGFLVQASGAAASVTIQKNKRVHNTSTLYKHLNTNTLTITAKANNYTDGLTVYFEPLATAGFDPNYDVQKLFGLPEAPQIATISGGTNLSVNALPEITQYTVIPMSFDCTVSSVDTLIADGATSFNPSLQVRLVDLTTNTTIDLRTQPTYIFTHTYDPNATTPRFNLLFGTNTVGIDENSDDLTIFASNRKINIMNPKLIKLAQIGVYNSLGQLVKLINSPATTSRIEVNADFSPGIYIVKAVDESGKIEIKKVHIN